MYQLPYFVEDDRRKVLKFMQENSFAVIAGRDDNYPVATHLPLEVTMVEDKLTLTGHMMKNTGHHKAFVKDENVLVIFNGPHCYISASWYTNPKVASTWNYITVHAKGKIQFCNEAQTRHIIEGITDKYEGRESPASFANLPDEYVDRLVKAIVGFTIEVESIDNLFKLSQNHEEQNRQSIVSHLMQNGSDDERKIGREMQQRMNTSNRQQ